MPCNKVKEELEAAKKKAHFMAKMAKKSGKTELGPLRGDQNSAMSDFRTAYLALTHAGLAPDVLIEGDPYASPSPLAIHELP